LVVPSKFLIKDIRLISIELRITFILFITAFSISLSRYI